MAFVHVGKTGGTSFRKFLQNTFKDTYEFLPKAHYLLKEITTETRGKKLITLIRDPLARYVSLRHYWLEHFWGPEESPFIKKSREVSFEDYVTILEDNIDNIQRYEDVLLVNGKLPKTLEVIKLENIEEELHNYFNIKHQLKVNINFPQTNSSTHDFYLNYYNEKTAERIYKLESFVYNMGWYQKRKLENIESER